MPRNEPLRQSFVAGDIIMRVSRKGSCSAALDFEIEILESAYRGM